jgi:phenylacetate-coenzyme A ligase PaaK-like adenylate-forming protein
VTVTAAASTATDELLAHDRWSREQLLEYQRARLREVIAHAVSSSSHYRETLGREALAEDVRLDELPTLSKQTLMERFDRVSADPRLRLAAVEAHAAGSDPGVLFAGEFHVFSTSGTTGRRGLFPETAAELDRWLAAGWAVRRRLGLDAGARVVGIGAPTPLHITQKLFVAFGGFGGGRPALSVTTPLPEIVDALNRDRPEGIVTVPTIAGMLAEEQLEGRLAIEPRTIIVGGEVLAEDVYRRTADAWGIEPFQVYSATEALFMAWEGPERAGFHVSEDLVVLEVVDQEDRPVPPGVPGYRLLLTSLVNRALPLIRYELADTLTLAAGPDPSGLPYRRIQRVDGRNDDLLRLPRAGGGEAIVLPYRLRAPFTLMPEVLQYQVVQRPDRLTVRVVLRPDASSGTADRVAAGVRSAVEAAGAVPPPIAVEPVEEIEREPGTIKVKVIKTVREAAA